MGDRDAADTARAWLTRDRDVGRDVDERARLDRLLHQIRDRVLAGAQLCPSQDVLDLGAGTGLLASAALTQVAPGGMVIALDRSRAALAEISVARRSSLYRLVGDAQQIPLAGRTVDAVLTRSVLIYLDDLPTALREIARVLRPGGRLSVFEPINGRRQHDGDLADMTAQELAAIDALRAQSSIAAPAMMAFGENRLIAAVTAAGLTVASLHVDQVTDRLGDHAAVDAYLHRRPHPGAPTPVELLTANLGPAAAARYTAAWHHALDQAAPRGGITFSTPVLYLTAVLPRSTLPAARCPLPEPADADARSIAQLPCPRLPPAGGGHLWARAPAEMSEPLNECWERDDSRERRDASGNREHGAAAGDGGVVRQGVRAECGSDRGPQEPRPGQGGAGPRRARAWPGDGQHRHGGRGHRPGAYPARHGRGPAVSQTHVCLYCHVRLTLVEAQTRTDGSGGRLAVRRCAGGAWHAVAADPGLELAR